MIISGTGVGTVFDRNTISNFYGSSSSGDGVSGVELQSSANVTLTNNVIVTSGGPTGIRSIYGIHDASGGACNYYFNSVNVTGLASGLGTHLGF